MDDILIRLTTSLLLHLQRFGYLFPADPENEGLNDDLAQELREALQETVLENDKAPDGLKRNLFGGIEGECSQLPFT